MSTPTINNLFPKFQPFLIGSQKCPINKTEIDNIFEQKLTPLKSDYIFEAGKWILKLGRTDGLLNTPDTHLYRIRKAEKIRSFIEQNNLGEHIEVPRKYLYWNEAQNQFYVIAEKMNLSAEVPTPASQDIEIDFKEDAATSGGQAFALANNAQSRSLTPTQAKALAELSVLGYTDLSYNNLYFTKEGKVAIIDTEPHKRSLKKRIKSNFFFSLFIDKGSVLTQQSIAGIAKLKLYTDNPIALQAVQRIEKNHVLWRIAQLITKISVVTMAIYFAPTKTASDGLYSTTLKVSFIYVAVLKDVFLTVNFLITVYVWNCSYKGLEGLGQILKMERQGQF